MDLVVGDYDYGNNGSLMAEYYDYLDNDTMGNYSYYPGYSGDQHYANFNFVQDTSVGSIQRQSAIFGIILSVWACVMNSIVICACLIDCKTRAHAYYMQVVNFCLANFLISTFVVPLTVYYILKPWNLGSAMCKVWIIFDVLLPCLSILILIVLNIDRLVLMGDRQTYSCIFQKCLTQIVLIAPWILSVVIVVPLWTHGTFPYDNGPGECIVAVSEAAALASPILTYFIPVVVVIILTLRILILRVRNEQPCEPQGPAKEGTACASEPRGVIRSDTDDCIIDQHTATTDSIVSLCLVNFFFVAMWFPFQCLSFLLSLCTSQVCVPSLLLNQALTWMGTASVGVLPLLWLVDENIRRNFCQMWRCCWHTTDTNISSCKQETFV